MIESEFALLTEMINRRIKMYAEKLILETDENGFFKQKTRLPPNSKVEAIFLVLEQSTLIKRKPAQEIAGKATCLVDLLQPIIPEENWQDLS
jgi:hypothetical protein